MTIIAALWSDLRRAIERGGVNDDVIASVCAAHGLRVEPAMEDIEGSLRRRPARRRLMPVHPHNRAP